MKLVPLAEEDDIVVSIVTDAIHQEWFTKGAGWRLVRSADNLPAALRAAGVKRMRLTKAEEHGLGEFLKAETYQDGALLHHYLYFQNYFVAVETKEAMTAAQLALMRQFGLEERAFQAHPLEYIELLGYEPEDGRFTLEGIGARKSLTAEYGKPEFVRRYRRGTQVLGVAKFDKVTQLIVETPQHFQDIYRELGITYSPDRLRRLVIELLGSSGGRLRAVLLNRSEVTLTVNQAAPGWAESLWEMCETAGGGVLAIEPTEPLPELITFIARA